MQTTAERIHGTSSRAPGAFMASVVIPACQSFVTAFGLGVSAGMLAWAAGYTADALGAGVTGGALGFVACFWVLTWRAGHSAICVTDDTTMIPSVPMPSGPSRMVLVNPRPNAEPGQDRAARFSAFVSDCERDTSMRRLRNLGYTDGEIVDFRDTLIRLNWARWNTTDKRGGWALTADPDSILEAMT